MMQGSQPLSKPMMHMTGSSPELMTGPAAIQEQSIMAHYLICLCRLMDDVSSTCITHKLGSKV